MASAGNDHRLGANEAPPAIISIFLGAQLNEVIENMINGSSGCGKRNDTLKIGVDTLPVLPRDATDRNRTSPFAFTGNKFEFRAPGSAQSCAGPMMTLNTIVAESLDSLAEELSSFAPETFLPQLQETLKRRISEHKRIIFNGDNYSEEWVKEAERRGLPNLKNTMTALHTLVNEKNVALFEKYGVFSRRELESRFEIFLEEYHRRIRIEGRLSWEMAATIILPPCATNTSKPFPRSPGRWKPSGPAAPPPCRSWRTSWATPWIPSYPTWILWRRHLRAAMRTSSPRCPD